MKIQYLLLFAFLPAFLVAQEDDGPVKYSNEFLAIGVGARAQAMGNSVAASTGDVYSTYWNPAALATFGQDVGLQIGAMHSEWFAGVAKYDYLGFVLPMGDGSRRLGLSINRFGIDNIPNTLNLYKDGQINYDNIFEFSAADYAFLISYAQPVQLKNSNLYVGGNVKVIRRVIGTFANSWGFGLDVSAQYRPKNWRFGLVGRDVTSTFNAWKTNFTEEEKTVLVETGNDLPARSSTEITRPSFLLGIGYQLDFGKVTVLPELNAHFTTDGQRNTLVSSDPISIDPSFGLEVGYNEFVFLRAGVNQFQYEKDFNDAENLTLRPSIGVGMQISTLTVDYAYTDLGDSQNTYSHVISLILNLKPKKK